MKEKDSAFLGDKTTFTKRIEQLKHDKISKLGEIRNLRLDKNNHKEDFHASKIEYELQQLLLRDIDWIKKQKVNILDREAKNALYVADRDKIKEQRELMLAERKKKDLEYKMR